MLDIGCWAMPARRAITASVINPTRCGRWPLPPRRSCLRQSGFPCSPMFGRRCAWAANRWEITLPLPRALRADRNRAVLEDVLRDFDYIGKISGHRQRSRCLPPLAAPVSARPYERSGLGTKAGGKRRTAYHAVATAQGVGLSTPAIPKLGEGASNCGQGAGQSVIGGPANGVGGAFRWRH